VVCADGTRLAVRAPSVGTVLLLHVLEHVPPAASRRLLEEALRVAQHRVVVAVPVEDRPDPVFGHARVFDLHALTALGRGTGWTVSLADAEGMARARPAPSRRLTSGRRDSQAPTPPHICSSPSWPDR
jgi:hypothetical protein